MVRRVSSARSFWAGSALATALAVASWAAPGVAVAGERSETDGLITQVNTLTFSAKLALNPLTGKASLVDASKLTQVLDPAGNPLTPLKVRAAAVQSGSPIGNYACVKQGNARKGFVEFNRTDWFNAGKHGVEQYQFFPYMQPGARTFGTVKTTQFQVCGTGGADLKDGYRIHQAGMGIAFPDAGRTFKIGQGWQAGKTPSDTTVSLGFELSDKRSPLSIKGSISQNPSDKLKGSIVGPYETSMDAFARNGVNAWWEDSCVNGWSRCKFKGDGSADFQGTVVHGLWEFSPADARAVRYFWIYPYLKYACHGFRCG